MSVVVSQLGPHGAPGEARIGADVDVPASLLVVWPGVVGQCRRDLDVPEEAGEVGAVVGHVFGPGGHRYDGGGSGIARAPEPLIVVPAHRDGKTDVAAQLVDGAGLTVVGCEYDGIAALEGTVALGANRTPAAARSALGK